MLLLNASSARFLEQKQQYTDMARKDQNEMQLERIARRLLATPPQPREPKSKRRKMLRRRPSRSQAMKPITS